MTPPHEAAFDDDHRGVLGQVRVPQPLAHPVFVVAAETDQVRAHHDGPDVGYGLKVLGGGGAHGPALSGTYTHDASLSEGGCGVSGLRHLELPHICLKWSHVPLLRLP